jgi:GDP-L-fucose synthase
MLILVTGATGFLGRFLCGELESAGHTVVRLNSKNCDLTRDDSLRAYTDDRYGQIVHLAAWTQAGDFCLRRPGEQWIVNQQINTNVLFWWQRYQPQAKLVCIGSSLYGPGYHTDGRQMHFIFDLIRKIMRGKERNEPVVLWGDGYQRRELVYVLDFVNAMVALSDRCDNEIINIGTGEEFTIRHFAKRICDRIGFDANAIEYDTSKYVGAVSKCLNIDKFRSLMPDRKVTPLEEGLDRTIGWFAENSDKYFP